MKAFGALVILCILYQAHGWINNDEMHCPPETEEGEDILYPDIYNCSCYYICDHGTPVHQECPEGLEWNKEIKQCDYPSEAKCVPELPPNSRNEGMDCPAENIEGQDVFHPDPHNCSCFYICDHGAPVHKVCPSNLEWNKELEQCDYPENAKCEAESFNSLSLRVDIDCKPGGGVSEHADPYDCTHYYLCDNGQLFRQPCPDGLHWADHLKRCDWPAVAKCTAISTPPTPSTPSTTVSTTVSGPTTPYPTSCPAENPPDRDILLANPYDCGSFYKCYNGVPILHKCPSGQEWADHLKRCDWPSIAQCSALSTPPTPSTPSTTVSTTVSGPTTPYPTSCPAENPPGEDILLANPYDCGSFYKCYNGVPILHKCPSGQEWADHLKRCDWPEIAQCKQHTTPSTTTISGPTTPYPTYCPNENPSGEDILLANPYDCGSFYKCYNGVPVLHKCPSGQEWADHLKRCDWPSIAQCSALSTPPTPSTPSTTVSTTVSGPTTPYPTTCPAENPPDRDILLPNPEDCKSFFKCDKGIPYLIPCPKGQEWADHLKRCDYPSIAQCERSGWIRVLYM